MSSKKVSKRSKGILPVINWILIAIAVVMGVYCGNWIMKIESVKTKDYASTIAHLAYEEAKLDDALEAARPQMEAMEVQCEQLLTEAKSEREAALRELNGAIVLRDEAQQELDDIRIWLLLSVSWSSRSHSCVLNTALPAANWKR